MINKLSLRHGIGQDENFENEWLKRGFSNRPGQIDEQDRLVVKKYYYALNRDFYQQLNELAGKNQDQFLNGILKLTGFSTNDIYQLIYFYERKENIFTGGNVLLETSNIVEKNNLEVPKYLSEEASYFKIKYGNKDIQFRIKPMNKFTTPE